MMSHAQWFENERQDYDATKQSRFRRRRTGLAPAGGSADYHYRNETQYLRLMESARDIDRNDMIVGQGINRLTDNVVQEGFTPDPRTGDKGVNTELSARWLDWSIDPEQCDITGEHTYSQIEWLAFRSYIVDGDDHILPLEGGQLQLMEGHRLRTPRNASRNKKNRIVHGVKLDEHRRRLEYWFTKDDIDPLAPLNRISDITKIPARDKDGNKQVFHIYDPRRVSQTRGITAFAPIFDPIGMHDDIQFAKLVQQQACSSYTIFHEWGPEAPGIPGQDNESATGEKSTETLADGSTREIRGISPGLDYFGTPGEKLHGFSPNIPNPQFFDQAIMILKFISVNLGLPIHVFLLDGTLVGSFSAHRGVVQQARMGMRRQQSNFSKRMHRQIWPWKVRQWMIDDPKLAEAANKSDVRIFRHNWNLPTWPDIEPLKDRSADLLSQRNAINSPRRIQAANSRNWDDVSTEIVEDNALAISKAKEAAADLNKNFPDDPDQVHWRELISLPTPDGIKINLTADAPDGDTADTPPPGNRDKETEDQ